MTKNLARKFGIRNKKRIQKKDMNDDRYKRTGSKEGYEEGYKEGMIQETDTKFEIRTSNSKRKC